MRLRKQFLATYGHSGHVESLIDDDDVAEYVASRDDLTDKQIDKLVNSDDAYAQAVIARNPRLRPEHFDKLVTHSEFHIRAAVARNTSIPDHHLDKLIDDPKRIVRWHATMNREENHG